MLSHLRLSINEPIRPRVSTTERWHAEDQGLIFCWERGRQLREEKPALATRAERGELVPLWWQGGVEKKLKATLPKKGTLWYLAVWQGLRNEDLDIDVFFGEFRECAKTGQIVHYKPFQTIELGTRPGGR